MKKKYFFSDKNFIKMILSVALPVSLQFLISTSINMADTVMISSLGGAEIAAVGQVNQYVFFFIVACFGVSSAGAVFFSQHFGDNDQDNVRRYLSLTLQLSILISVVFTFFSILFPEHIMRVLIPDEEVIKHGSLYLRLISITFIPTAISQVYNTVLRSVNRAREPLFVSFISFILNVLFNYIFIFGKFGAPALGVAGAALGTIIARFAEIIILNIIIYKEKHGYETITPLDLFKIDRLRIKNFIPIALPIIMAEVFWALGQLLFSMAYARIGKDATASIQLTGTIQNIFFIIVNSLNTAAAILIGQTLGSSRKDKAEVFASYFLQINTLIGFISLLVLVFMPHTLMKIYSNIEPQIYNTAINLLIIRGIFIPFRFINGMLFVGIFRAGGETKLPLIFELCTMWLFAIPMSFIGVLVFKWPIEWIFSIVSFEELVKLLLIMPLYKKKRWLNNITSQEKTTGAIA
ncbi:MATE family efflux transporter [Helcococcus kunzii]|uniref:MATE family efflux transporter n=1 Tax=Helcococcus kunzii TaxID=40091 RepID=UPI0021A432CA|nr:MATE family efflux transporter [Helcococcus kunzii]MCT1795449.1 MATE family efflux transporter [Helcococcus kunzii]MCT1989593.1 MATE family efflux transporter [Helcococcus kunzii]